MAIDWATVWAFLWPILKQGIVALLVSILALLEYDKLVPSRYARRSGEEMTPEYLIYAKHRAEGMRESSKMVEGLKLGKRV